MHEDEDEAARIDREEAEQILAKLISNHGGMVRPEYHAEKRMVTAKISNHAHEGLKRIAKGYGYTWKGTGNVSMLLEAIGSGMFTIKPR